MSSKLLFRQLILLFLLLSPFVLFAQGHENASTETKVEFPLEPYFEWIETIADVVGIAILIIGFLKGIFMFLRLEIDRLRGKKDYEEIKRL